MLVLTVKYPLNHRLRRRGGDTAFRRYPLLFYAVVGTLLAFYAVAMVHEMIPGLCNAGDFSQQECPFCKLAHALTLLVLAFVPVLYGTPLRRRILVDLSASRNNSRYPRYLLRAPPRLLK